MKTLFALNPALDRSALAAEYAAAGRVQVRDVLTRDSALELRGLLERGTPWSMAIGAGSAPVSLPNRSLNTPEGRQRVSELARAAQSVSAKGDYAFRYAHYPIVDALNQRWDPDGPFEILLEHLNAPEFLDLARVVTGITALRKADAQATLYAPNHYLGLHHDSHVALGWKVAYVLNLAPDDWHPDWGGYLNFLDDDGDIVAGYRPRFNALNLFAVPQPHCVSYLPPFAPAARFAITGWLSDR